MVHSFVARVAVLLVSLVFPATLCAFTAQAQNAPCLRIGSSFGDKHSTDDLMEGNMRAVLASLGLCAEIVKGPPKRLTEALLRGEIDGELVRVKEYGRAVAAKAILVDEPLAEANGYLIARAGIDLAETAEPSLSIGILRGVRWHQAASADAKKIAIANNMDQLTEMLRNGRVDAILVGGFLREEYPELAGLPSRIVYRTTLHFVLHRSHADIADEIAEGIRVFRGKGCSFLMAKGGTACSESSDIEGGLAQSPAAAPLPG